MDLPKELIILLVSYLNDITYVKFILDIYTFEMSQNDWLTLFNIKFSEYICDNIKSYNIEYLYYGALIYSNIWIKPIHFATNLVSSISKFYGNEKYILTLKILY
jgi:hypothetical protein